MRRNLAWAGVLAAAGVLVNPWSVTHLLLPAGKGIPLEGRMAIWAFQGICLASSGLLLLRRRDPGIRRKMTLAALTLTLMLVGVEGTLQVARWLFPAPHEEVDPRSGLPQYKDQAWARDYWREYRLVKTAPKRFEPHLLWVTREFQGRYINVDAAGHRKTWRPDTGASAPSPSLFMMGGSTVWGTGSRDEFTIPSRLAKTLHAEGFDLEVHNYGEMAYTFTQGVVRLALLLREGKRPSCVVSYDGFNDVYAAYQSGRAGTIQNLSQMMEQVSATGNQFLWLWLSDLFRNRCLTFQALGRIRAAVSGERPFSETGAGYTEAQLSRLAAGVVEEYVRSLSLLDGLSRAYGFSYLCFWQPVVYWEGALTAEESQSDPRIKDAALAALFRAVRGELRARSPERVFDLSDALEGRSGPCYIDICHLNEDGDQRVAARLFSILQREILRGPAGEEGM